MSDIPKLLEPPPPANVVTDEDLKESYAGSAPIANRIIASNTAAGMRLTFLEQNLPKVLPKFRSAVFLSYADAQSLRDLLTLQLQRAQLIGSPALPVMPKAAS